MSTLYHLFSFLSKNRNQCYISSINSLFKADCKFTISLFLLNRKNRRFWLFKKVNLPWAVPIAKQSCTLWTSEALLPLTSNFLIFLFIISQKKTTIKDNCLIFLFIFILNFFWQFVILYFSPRFYSYYCHYF